MKVLKKILQKLNGLQFKQEYICLSRESLAQPLHAYIIREDKVIKDITGLHLFVGYCPVIFAFAPATLSSDEFIKIVFTDQIWQKDQLVLIKKIVAMMKMKKIHQFATSEGIILLYEGVRGSHRFISRFNQLIVQLNNRLYNRKPGNVYLESNLYKQVQIAYGIPRVISLITLKEDNLFNVFPSDLHGQVSENFYAISLRHEGKACSQVEKIGNLVISTPDAGAYKEVYALGKNHMQELKPKEQFHFSEAFSEKLQIALPFHVLEYRELELTDSFKHGIHKILLFRILNFKKLQTRENSLSHIHCSYATWRGKQGLTGNYLMR
jgi:hypothetical protein